MEKLLGIGLVVLTSFNAWAAAPQATTLALPKGVVATPDGTTKSVSQLQVRFPEEMVKDSRSEAFTVKCSPEIAGFSSWADNNTVWTYNFKAADEDSSPRLVGGASCVITQSADIRSAAGTLYKSGSIGYSVTVPGPNVTSVTQAEGFQGSLRETDPVILITFDGPVDAAAFFADQNGYFNYTSASAPSEKIPLAAVPQDQSEKIFSRFKATAYLDVNFSDKTWLIATIQRPLISGSQVNLTVEKQASSANPSVHSDVKFAKEFSVRSSFQAEVKCDNPTAKGTSCVPDSSISIALNGMVKWADLKDAYIEYIPAQSVDHKTVRSYPEIEAGRQLSLWDNVMYELARYFPFLAKYGDTIVDGGVFNVHIEPLTQASIVLPKGLTDVDGRILSNVIPEFHIRIGAIDEMVNIPHHISFFEKQVPNLYLPIGIVNQNQKISIRKTGATAQAWEPIRDVDTMIKVIRAYALRGEYRSTPNYESPLIGLSVVSNSAEEKLSGLKNRQTILQFPFADPKVKTPLASGLYPIEISSPTYEAMQSHPKDNQYYNPEYVLAQVTDLAIHLKRGETQNLAWVTHLSNTQPVAAAQLDIYNCLGQKIKTVTADANGLATFPTQAWATDCAVGKGDDTTDILQPSEFFVVAKSGDDFTLVHSSWDAPSASPYSQGIEFSSSNIYENRPHYHAVIGVNLVKPGQTVPVELFAKIPDVKGFHNLAAKDLPKSARISSNDDDSIFYDFPLTWVGDAAVINWAVPADSSAPLGSYSIAVGDATGKNQQPVESGDIEVAEFKIPLMSGLIAFPNQALVRPDSIPLNTVIRYANGVGAKNLATDISYYFTPTSMHVKELPGFVFGTGPMTATGDDENAVENQNLPTRARPATMQGLKTGADGSLVKDIAKEAAANGKTIAEVLKSVDRPQHLVARVRYQDQIGEYQTLSQAKDVYNSDSYVGLSLISGARGVAKLQAAVVDVNSKNQTSIADLDLKVIRVETRVIGEELFGGLVKNTIERELKPVRWVQNCSMVNQVASCAVGALKEGSYAFEVTSKSNHQAAHVLFKVDTDGRIYGPNDYYSFGDDEEAKQLPLALDKKEYKAGDSAVVSFSAPFKTCSALVTIERSDVVTSFIAPNACERGQVSVPVNAEMAPNAFVSVYAITGRADSQSLKPGDIDLGRPTYRIGYANLKVNWSRFKSSVTVATDKQVYEPGQNVNVSVNVKADQGSLGTGTVTLVAIEEKILELKPNDTYNILNDLMQQRSDGVRTITALTRVETVANGNADFPTRKGGDEGGDGSSKSDFKRKLFNALVTFQPNVPVVNGVAKFTFKTNDSLTKFKIFAVAMDSNQKFGLGDAEYLSEKDTQIYSNNPAVTHTGDSYPLKVTAQNNSGKDGKFRVEFKTVIKDRNGKVISSKTQTKEATIAKSSSQTIDVGQMDVPEDGATIESSISVYDENGKLVDSMTPDTQTILASTPLAIHDAFVSQMENGSLTRNLEKDPAALDGQGQIRVSTSKSLVSSALTQIGQRTENMLIGDFLVEWKFDLALLHSSEAKPAELVKVLDFLVNDADSNGFLRLYAGQSRGSLYLTASVLNSLQQEPWALKVMPVALADKLKNAVGAVLTKSVDPVYISGRQPTAMDWMRAQVVMARAAYALNDAGLISAAKAIDASVTGELKRNPKAYGEPIENWSNRDLTENFLLKSLTSPQSALTSQAYKILTATRLVLSGNMAQLNGGPTDGFFYSDETTESAQLLIGQSRLKADKGLARSLAVGLVGANVKGWYNLSTMVKVAEGLKSFGRTYEADVVGGTALLNVPEMQKSSSVDFGTQASGSLTTDWTTRKATVQVTHAGAGLPWVSVEALSAVPLTAARGQGISIEKEIHNLTHDSGYQAGDIIEVTLKINANAVLRHITLLDPIPSGSNILSDAYGDLTYGQKAYAGYKMYFEQLPNGVSTVKFQYQLNNPGHFKMPPTRAEGLYMPSLFAETPNATLTVQ